MKAKYSRNLTIVMIACLLLLCCAETSIIYNPLASETSNRQNDQSLSYEQEDWWLTNLELLTSTSTGGSTSTSMVIDSNDNIHIVWEDFTNDLLSSGSDSDVFYKFYDSSTETWSAEELVSSESDGNSREPCLGVDSIGNAHVCWKDISDYLSSGTDDDIFYKMRNSMGTWSTTTVLSTLSTGYVDRPDLKIDSDDNIHVVYEDPTDILSAGGDEDIFYLWFNSSLSLWTTAYLVSSESTSNSIRASLAIDPLSGKPYFVWADGTDLFSNGPDSDIFSKSYDHSTSSFSPVILVTDESDVGSYVPDIDFNSKGVPYVFWYDYANMLGSGGDGDIYYKYLNTISNEWVGFELISSESTANVGGPKCVIDKEDRIYVFWEDYTDILGAGTDMDLFLKYKNPSATTWSELKLVSEESTNFASEKSIAVDSEGFVSLSWSDYDDLLSSGIDEDVYYKKFVGTPNTPVLSLINPNPTSEVNVSLNWEYNPHISSYSLYRSTSPFTSASLGSMSPIATPSTNSFYNILNETGVYYYGVVAHNIYGDSGLSNVESVQFVEDGVSDGFLGFLSSLSALEILTIVGAIVLSQVIITVIIVAIFNIGSKSKGQSKKKK